MGARREVGRGTNDLLRLNALGLGRVDLVGFSLAGVELTRFAALHPDRVGKLVYLDATPVHTTGSAPSAPEPPRPSPSPATIDTPSDVSLVRIDFQPAGLPTPDGWIVDDGGRFGPRGNGYTYGWSEDNAQGAKKWNDPASPDPRYDSAVFMRKQWDDLRWEIALPSGTYKLRVVAGAPDAPGAVYGIAAETIPVIDDDADTVTRWIDEVATVTVRDGRLTLSSLEGAPSNDLCFVEICAAKSCPDSFRSRPRRSWPLAADLVASRRASWRRPFPEADIEPLIADDLEAFVIRPDRTVRRRMPGRMANLIDDRLSLGDLAHVDDTKLTRPALFLRAVPRVPNAEQEQLKRAKLDAYQANGSHVHVVELADTSHLCFIERKDEVARRMRAFLLGAGTTGR